MHTYRPVTSRLVYYAIELSHKPHKMVDIEITLVTRVNNVIVGSTYCNFRQGIHDIIKELFVREGLCSGNRLY